MVPTAHQQQLAAESLYRDANSLLYADNKPSDEAIDRVIGKINQEYVSSALSWSPLIDYFNSIDKRRKFSRKRPNEDTGDVTYINEKNRIFNKKVQLLSARTSIFADFSFPRLHATTTNIPRRYAPVSSVERPYERQVHFVPVPPSRLYLLSVRSYCIITYFMRPRSETGLNAWVKL